MLVIDVKFNRKSSFNASEHSQQDSIGPM